MPATWAVPWGDTLITESSSSSRYSFMTSGASDAKGTGADGMVSVLAAEFAIVIGLTCKGWLGQ